MMMNLGRGAWVLVVFYFAMLVRQPKTNCISRRVCVSKSRERNEDEERNFLLFVFLPFLIYDFYVISFYSDQLVANLLQSNPNGRTEYRSNTKQLRWVVQILRWRCPFSIRMPIAVLRTVSAEFRIESVIITVRSSSDPLVSLCEQFGRSERRRARATFGERDLYMSLRE